MDGCRVGLDGLFFLLNLLFYSHILKFSTYYYSFHLFPFYLLFFLPHLLFMLDQTVINNSMQTVLYTDEQVYTTLYRLESLTL